MKFIREKVEEKLKRCHDFSDITELIVALVEDNEKLEKQFHFLDMECCRLEALEDKYHFGIQKIKEYTVRKMQERLEERINQTIQVFDFQISECNAVRQVLRGVKSDIYQIAKEMLEENNDLH